MVVAEARMSVLGQVARVWRAEVLMAFSWAVGVGAEVVLGGVRGVVIVVRVRRLRREVETWVLRTAVRRPGGVVG
jgi:hypothetical protein